MELLVRARVYPTEDPEKVERAVKNLFRLEVRREGELLTGLGEGREALARFHELLRSQGILDAARHPLEAGLLEGKLRFFLNRQAAYIGLVNFVEEETKSLLGPIEVEVKGEDLPSLIRWLAPRTESGKIVER